MILLFNDVHQRLDHEVLLSGDSSVDERLVLWQMLLFSVFHYPVGEELEQDNGVNIEFLHQ